MSTNESDEWPWAHLLFNFKPPTLFGTAAIWFSDKSKFFKLGNCMSWGMSLISFLLILRSVTDDGISGNWESLFCERSRKCRDGAALSWNIAISLFEMFTDESWSILERSKLNSVNLLLEISRIFNLLRHSIDPGNKDNERLFLIFNQINLTWQCRQSISKQQQWL